MAIKVTSNLRKKEEKKLFVNVFFNKADINNGVTNVVFGLFSTIRNGILTVEATPRSDDSLRSGLARDNGEHQHLDYSILVNRVLLFSFYFWLLSS